MPRCERCGWLPEAEYRRQHQTAYAARPKEAYRTQRDLQNLRQAERTVEDDIADYPEGMYEYYRDRPTGWE